MCLCFGMHYFCVLSSFEIVVKSKRELVALLLLFYGRLVTVNVLRLTLAVPLVGLHCVKLVFPYHTHFWLKINAVY